MTPKSPLLATTPESAVNNQYFTPKPARILSIPENLKLPTPKNVCSFPATCTIEISALKTSRSCLETWLKSLKTSKNSFGCMEQVPKNVEHINNVSNSSEKLVSKFTPNFTNFKFHDTNGRVKKNDKYEELDKNKASRRDVLSLNIAELFVSGKRKRKPDENTKSLKQSKKDKENFLAESVSSCNLLEDSGSVPRIKDLLDHAEDSTYF